MTDEPTIRKPATISDAIKDLPHGRHYVDGWTIWVGPGHKPETPPTERRNMAYWDDAPAMTDEELIALADKIAPYVPANDATVMFISAEYVRAMIAGIRALVAERGR